MQFLQLVIHPRELRSQLLALKMAQESERAPQHNDMNEPTPRCLPYSAVVDGKFYIWGGGPMLRENLTEEQFLNRVEVFDPHLEKWTSVQTKGTCPPGIFDGASTVRGRRLYTFGGSAVKRTTGRSDNDSFNQSYTIGDSRRYFYAIEKPDVSNQYGSGNKLNRYGSLHEFDVDTCTWSLLSKRDNPDRPREIVDDLFWRCKMLCYKDTLILFGSTCSIHNIIGSRRKANDLFAFDLKNRIWSKPEVTGKPPPIAGEFSLTMIDSHRAVLFGGYLGRDLYNSDTYILDFEKMEWTKLSVDKKIPHPIGSSDHVATCLGYGDSHPQLLVHGGKRNNKVLSSLWTLNIFSKQWKKVSQFEFPKLPRHTHCIGTFRLSSSLMKVVMFGGRNSREIITNTVVFILECQERNSGIEWIPRDVAIGSEKGTPERIESLNQQLLSSDNKDQTLISSCVSEIILPRRQSEVDSVIVERQQGPKTCSNVAAKINLDIGGNGECLISMMVQQQTV